MALRVCARTDIWYFPSVWKFCCKFEWIWIHNKCKGGEGPSNWSLLKFYPGSCSWAVHVARMEAMKNTECWSGHLSGRDHSEDLGLNGQTVLE